MAVESADKERFQTLTPAEWVGTLCALSAWFTYTWPKCGHFHKIILCSFENVCAPSSLLPGGRKLSWACAADHKPGRVFLCMAVYVTRGTAASCTLTAPLCLCLQVCAGGVTPYLPSILFVQNESVWKQKSLDLNLCLDNEVEHCTAGLGEEWGIPKGLARSLLSLPAGFTQYTFGSWWFRSCSEIDKCKSSIHPLGPHPSWAAQTSSHFPIILHFAASFSFAVHDECLCLASPLWTSIGVTESVNSCSSRTVCTQSQDLMEVSRKRWAKWHCCCNLSCIKLMLKHFLWPPSSVPAKLPLRKRCFEGTCLIVIWVFRYPAATLYS